MNKYFLPFILLFASLSVQSQSNEWLVGLSGSSVKLNKSNVLDASLNDLHNFQFPKLNVSIFKLYSLYGGACQKSGFQVGGCETRVGG